MNATLQLLAGDEEQFRKGLVELGWFDYPPTLTNEPFLGRARISLDPRFRSAGEVAGTGASVYRLTLTSHRWQDAVKVVESQLNRRPHFAVVFVTLPRAVMIVVPEDPDKACTEKPGIQVAQIFLDTTREDNHVNEVIKRLKAAKRDGFRKKLQDSADVKRVTDGFYKDFKKQKELFADLIENIASEENRQWYASVLLNRLMFIYFIQSNGLMEQGYLRKKLEMYKSRNAPPHPSVPSGQALTSPARGEEPVRPNANYYRDFLCPLFFQGLAVEQRERSRQTALLLGDVPYLNGGLFMEHKLEKDHPDISIRDEAFANLFSLFDEYTWYIDDRPIAREREINPDVLGYIFEKLVISKAEQKEKGAYYTKEDITGYICRNTIIPRLFDMLAEARGFSEFCLPIKEIEPYIWDAVKHGVEEPLPDFIEVGVDNVSERSRWNETAPANFALPTETWRELIARRQRYADILSDFGAGKITTANDFITYNLDLPRAALDFVHQCTDASILSDLYFRCLQRITVLDPTCGSGAFLFAALNILFPLYEACLDRMEELKSADRVEDRPLLTMKGEFDFANEVDMQQTFMDPDFDPYTVTTAILERCQAELDRIADQRHPNRSYYIHKTIIVNNLYGVDIMEEAVEICKLRLFLNLISHADPDPSKENLGIEPLPDIDFNILAGNTLVGYTSIEDIDKQWHRVLVEQSRLDLERDHSRLRMMVEEYGRLIETFRKQQLGEDLDLPIVTKEAVLRAREVVQPELDEDLWKLYRNSGLYDDPPRKRLKDFQHSHRPFHWFLEFPRVMAGGGFDVCIGNPPWREYSAAKKDYEVAGYSTLTCGNLYALCTERSMRIRFNRGSLGFIVQLPLVCSPRMAELRTLLREYSATLSVATFDDRPGKLFDGLQHCRSAVFISSGSAQSSRHIFVTGYNRWPTASRSSLFHLLAPTQEPDHPDSARVFLKLHGSADTAMMTGLLRVPHDALACRLLAQPSAQFVFYQESAQYWAKAVVGLPHYSLNGRVGPPPHGRYLYLDTSCEAAIVAALMNSSLFYMQYIAFSDCFHVNQSMVEDFAVPASVWEDCKLPELADHLMESLHRNAERKTINTRDGNEISYEEFVAGESKPIIDEIDRVLAKHYGFTNEQLDFIINYDIKYRVGKGGEHDAGDGDN